MNDLVARMVATRIAIGEEGVFTRVVEAGRLPHLGDTPQPWEVRGWLLPLVMDLHPEGEGRGTGRWRFWLQAKLEGALPGPIPRVEWLESGHGTPAWKNLEACTDAIARSHSVGQAAARDLIDWLAFALGFKDQLLPPFDPPLHEHLYRTFDACLWHDHPADHLGHLLAEWKSGGHDPAAFFPTPLGVCEVMARLVFGVGGETSDPWASVYDPAVGTGRFLLVASNHSLRLVGQDIDRHCVLATLINGAILAPWLAYPLQPPQGAIR